MNIWNDDRFLEWAEFNDARVDFNQVTHTWSAKTETATYGRYTSEVEAETKLYNLYKETQ